MAGRARVAFLGNDEWSVPSLRALSASAHEVVFVGTATPRPSRRGGPPAPTPVAEAARAAGLPPTELDTVKAGPGFDTLAAAAPDVLVVVAYGELLPPAVLEVPSIAPINLHFSLLPELRGASPVQTALLRGMTRTGVTTIVMDRGLDTGPVVRRREVAIEPDDDAGSLGDRLAMIGAEVLVESVASIAADPRAVEPQDDRLATSAPKLGPEDRVLAWADPARSLVDRCRALSPEPGAVTTFRGETLKVLRGRAVSGSGEPGRIVSVERDEIVVATGAGGFAPVEVVPAGRRRMSGSDLVNGLRPRVGERLG